MISDKEEILGAVVLVKEVKMYRVSCSRPAGVQGSAPHRVPGAPLGTISGKQPRDNSKCFQVWPLNKQ